MPGGWHVAGLPAIVRWAGPHAAERRVEFSTAQIRNANTRAAYGVAVTRFFAWCDARGLDLTQISPIAVASYLDALQRPPARQRSNSIWRPSGTCSTG